MLVAVGPEGQFVFLAPDLPSAEPVLRFLAPLEMLADLMQHTVDAHPVLRRWGAAGPLPPSWRPTSQRRESPAATRLLERYQAVDPTGAGTLGGT